MALGDLATGALEFIDGSPAAVSNIRFPTVWSKTAIVTREQQLLFVPLVNRVWEGDLDRYGQTVHVPSVSNLSVQTKSISSTANNASATQYETVVEVNTDITINTWEYQALAVETATSRLGNVDFLKLYAPKQGFALAQSVDNALAALVDGGGLTNSVGTLLVPLSYDDVLSGRQKLDDAEVPMDDRTMIIAPIQERDFMKLDQFVHRDYESIHGSPSRPALNRGYIGQWVNMPVYKTTNVDGSNGAGHSNVIMHREAFALVMAYEGKTHTWFDLDHLADKVVTEQLYGVALMRADHAIWLKGL